MLMDLLKNKSGVCRHRAVLFELLARYWGIETRQVSNQFHRFIEYSLDNGASWNKVIDLYILNDDEEEDDGNQYITRKCEDFDIDPDGSPPTINLAIPATGLLAIAYGASTLMSPLSASQSDPASHYGSSNMPSEPPNVPDYTPTQPDTSSIIDCIKPHGNSWPPYLCWNSLCRLCYG